MPKDSYFFLAGLTRTLAGILQPEQQYITGPPFLRRTATVLVLVLVFESAMWQTGHSTALALGLSGPAKETATRAIDAISRTAFFIEPPSLMYTTLVLVSTDLFSRAKVFRSV